MKRKTTNRQRWPQLIEIAHDNPICVCGHQASAHGQLTDHPNDYICIIGDCDCKEFRELVKDETN